MNAHLSKDATKKRQKRIDRGLDDEAAAKAWSNAVKPSGDQLVIPLLTLLERRGGNARPGELYDELADVVDIDPELRSMELRFANGQRSNLWERQVRWARESAKRLGYLTSKQRGIWQLTKKGGDALGLAEPGMVITVFHGRDGESWWARAEDAVGLIEPGSVDLIFTSPAYPLLIDKRGYGTMSVPAWLDWMFGLAEAWQTRLSDQGSLMINLGPVGISGQPAQSPYIERLTLALIDELDYSLMDRFYWNNPTRLPPMEWVAKRRIRCRPSVEPFLWFSKSLNVKTNNNRVLEDYKTNRWMTEEFHGTRPSGFDFKRGKSFQPGAGRIPGTLIEESNAASNSLWRKAIKRAGLPAHPAVMPESVASFFVKFMTEPGDLVYDPFLGSGTTAIACEKLGRRWIGSDRSLAYVHGQAVRMSMDVAA